MEIGEVREKLCLALDTLLTKDGLLLEFDVLERCVCGRLAIYMDALFPEHDVDIEYNRHEIDPKRLDFEAGCREGEGLLVIPDLIVHRRGNDDENLLVLEMKLSTNNEPRACDEEKLAGFIEDYSYRFGVLVDLPAKEDVGQAPELIWLARTPEGAAQNLD